MTNDLLLSCFEEENHIFIFCILAPLRRRTQTSKGDLRGEYYSEFNLARRKISYFFVTNYIHNTLRFLKISWSVITNINYVKSFNAIYLKTKRVFNSFNS